MPSHEKNLPHYLHAFNSDRQLASLKVAAQARLVEVVVVAAAAAQIPQKGRRVCECSLGCLW